MRFLGNCNPKVIVAVLNIRAKGKNAPFPMKILKLSIGFSLPSVLWLSKQKGESQKWKEMHMDSLERFRTDSRVKLEKHSPTATKTSPFVGYVYLDF